MDDENSKNVIMESEGEAIRLDSGRQHYTCICEKCEKSLLGMYLKRDSGFIRSGDLSISFDYSCSPNGRYAIIPVYCKDTWILTDNGVIISKGSVLQPTDVHIADNGRFVIKGLTRIPTEYNENGVSPFNEIYFVFSPEGQLLYQNQINGFYQQGSISPNGLYTVYWWVEPDNGCLVFLNIETQTIDWSHKGPFDLLCNLEFNDEHSILNIFDKKGRCYRFAYDGLSHDMAAIERDILDDELQKGYGYPLRDLAYKKMENLNYQNASDSEYSEILDLLDRAAEMKMFITCKVRAYVKFFEILEKAGKWEEASACYRKAECLLRSAAETEISNSDKGRFYKNLSEILEKAGMSEEAILCYQEIENLLNLDIGLGLSDILTAKTYRQLGEIAEKTGRYGEAIAWYESAMNKDKAVGIKGRLKRLKAEHADSISNCIDHKFVMNQYRRKVNELISSEMEIYKSDRHYQLVAGSKAFEITQYWPTKHPPKIIALTADEEILWTAESSISCQKAENVKWITKLHGTPKQLATTGNYIYVISRNGNQDTGALTILDNEGRVLVIQELLGSCSTMSVNKQSGRTLVLSAQRRTSQAKAILVNGENIINSINCDVKYSFDNNVICTKEGYWVINCFNELFVVDGDGKVSARVTPPKYYTKEDSISSIKIDEDSGSVFILTHSSHKVYQLDGTHLNFHSFGKDYNIHKLLYSESGGSAILVSSNEGLYLHPSGSVVARLELNNAYCEWRVIKSLLRDRIIVYSPECDDLFVCTSSFTTVNHMKSAVLISDAVIDPLGKHIYLAKGSIEVARFC